MLQFLNIRSSLFWDVDPDILSEENNRTLIIERVLNLGNLEEWKEIVRYYGLETIKAEVVKAGDLFPKTVAFVESYLKIPKKELRCYIKKRLTLAY